MARRLLSLTLDVGGGVENVEQWRALAVAMIASLVITSPVVVVAVGMNNLVVDIDAVVVAVQRHHSFHFARVVAAVVLVSVSLLLKIFKKLC